MNAQEVCHQFAAGNYRKSGNVFADAATRTLYSYGTHFPMARFTGNPEIPVLMTNRGYSVTTAKHISWASQALSHFNPVFVYNPAADSPHAHAENYRAMIQDAFRSFEAAGAPRVRPGTRAASLSNAAAGLANSERYRKAFKVPLSALGAGDASARRSLLAMDPADIDGAREAATTAKAKREETARRKAAKQIREWQAGESDSRPNLPGPALLRVKGNAVETSQGARVHVTHAARLWPLVERVRKSGNPVRPEGVKVGDYTLTEIRPDGVTIGCHVIPYGEMKRISAEVLEAAKGTLAEA